MKSVPGWLVIGNPKCFFVERCNRYKSLAPATSVDRLEPRCRDQPREWIMRNPIGSPTLQGYADGVLERIFG